MARSGLARLVFGTSVTWWLLLACAVTCARSQEDPTRQHGMQDGSSHAKVPMLSIFLYTTLMALASGLGAIPFFIFGQLRPFWAGIANAVAVGVMLAASFDLLHEGAPHSPALTILGMIVGALFIKCSQDYLSQFEDASFENLQGADARKAMLIITVMAAHAFGEGSGVGVSFSGQRGWAKGLLVTIAIALHNVPEGMAVAGVMMSKGSSPGAALYWTLVAAFPQAIVSVPSYLFVETFSSLLPVALGFAAGCMLWIAFAELLPDALDNADHGLVATAATFSAAWLQGLSMFIASLEQPSGSLASPIQADAGTLTMRLLGLMPCLLAPLAATAAAVQINAPLPLLLGAAAGSLGWMGGAALLYLATIGRASMLACLSSAAGGACIAAMLLMASRKTSEGKEHKEEQAAYPEQGRAVGHANGVHGSEPLAIKHQHDRNGSHLGELHARASHPGSPTKSAAAVHGNHNNWRCWVAARSISGAERQGKLDIEETCGHVPEDQLTLPPLTVNKPLVPSVLLTLVSRSPYDGHGLQYSKAASLMEDGQVVLSRLNSIGYGNAESLPLYQGDKQHGQGDSAPFVACVLLAQGVPLGLALARAVAANPDVPCSHLLLPTALSALPLGVACAGIGRVLSGTQGLRLPGALAAAVATVAGISAASFLVGLPLGKDNTSVSRQAMEFESWMPLAEASVAGAMLLAAVRHTWPLAAPSRSMRAHAGFGAAMCLGAGASLSQALLCASSPYCLR